MAAGSNQLTPRKDAFVALKLLTIDCYGTDHDIFEVDILRTVTHEQARLSGDSKTHCLGLLDTFQLKGPRGTHECIVMPVVGGNIMDQATRYTDNRIPTAIMKEITKQLLLGLCFLHDKCEVIHTGIIYAEGTPSSSLGPLTKATRSASFKYLLRGRRCRCAE